MSYNVLQTSRFARQYKKLHRNAVANVDEAVIKIVDNPELGERKKGDLANLRVYKFHINTQLYLLGYTVDDTVELVYLEAIGGHENFYRDIKR